MLKYFLGQNYAYCEYWKKMAQIQAISGKKEFKALPKLHRPLYIFGFLIRQFQITGLSPVQLLWSSFHFMLWILGFWKPWKVWTLPILKMTLAAKQVKPFKVFEMFHCLSLCMNVMFFFLPPSQCFIEELYPSTVFWLGEWNRAMGYSFNEYS